MAVDCGDLSSLAGRRGPSFLLTIVVSRNIVGLVNESYCPTRSKGKAWILFRGDRTPRDDADDGGSVAPVCAGVQNRGSFVDTVQRAADPAGRSGGTGVRG